MWYIFAMTIKTFFDEFKTFAIKGNVMDLAIGVVIGTAFSKIVSSLVEDVITPLIGMIGSFDFSTWTIGQIKIGLFINNVINFFIVAFTIFIVIRFLNKIIRRRERLEEKEGAKV
ncbi:MAG: hypothetical protein RJB39_150 [Candidatus Parcubacteria bacterium]|jgi:large conductance mechanosensitive channel